MVKKKTGTDPSATAIYMHHFLGAGGVSKFINAMRRDPNASAARMMPEAAKANNNIFYTKSGQERSLGQVYNLMRQKVSAAESNVKQFAPAGSISGTDLTNLPGDNEARRDEVIEQKGARDGTAIQEGAGASALPNPAGVKDTSAPPDMSSPMSTAADGVEQSYPTVSPEQKEKYANAASQVAVAADAPVATSSDAPADTPNNTLSLAKASLDVQRKMLNQLMSIVEMMKGGSPLVGDRSPASTTASAPAATVTHGAPTINTARIVTQ